MPWVQFPVPQKKQWAKHLITYFSSYTNGQQIYDKVLHIIKEMYIKSQWDITSHLLD